MHVSVHHKKCKSNGGSSANRNLVAVDPKYHEAWHMLFRNWDAYAIAETINKVWLDPDFRFEVHRIF